MTDFTDRASWPALYKAGYTLQEIATPNGITRERVRQILTKRYGMSAPDGGAHVKSVKKRAASDHARGVKTLLNTGMKREHYALVPNSLKGAFRQQRNSAMGRGIQWRMTLREWLKVWEDSGVMHLRGRGADKYCMARIDDKGPYSVSNVKVITNRQNVSEYAVAKREGARKNNMTVRRGVWLLYPGRTQRFGVRINGKMRLFETADEAIAARLSAINQQPGQGNAGSPAQSS